MMSKQKAYHSLNKKRTNTASESKQALKESNEKDVDGIIVELGGFQGLVEFKIKNKKERALFFKNKVLVNGKKLDKQANLMDIMEEGAEVRLKVKPSVKTGRFQYSKVLKVEYKDRMLENNCASTSHSFSLQNNARTTTNTADTNQVIAQNGASSGKTTVSRSPYINCAAGTVINLSDSTGIVFTDPDNNGGCKVSFEINNMFINGEKWKEKSFGTCLHLGQSVNCTATKANEKDSVEYKAFAVWIGSRPLFLSVLRSYVPKMKSKNLKKGTVCRGTVKLLAPPKAAVLALESDNYAVMFFTYLCNVKPDDYGWIGDYVQVGDILLVKISGHYQNLCYAVSAAWRVNEATELGQRSQIACVTYQDTGRNEKVGWMENMSYSTSESGENNKSPGNNETSRLFEESKSQKMKRTVFNGRTGKVVSYSSKSRGLISDPDLGHVKFYRRIVIFPAGLEHLDLQEYIPVGSTVYYNSHLLEKNQNYVCTKLWIGKKDKQTDFNATSPLILECPNRVLTEGETYKAIVRELQMPHGIIVETVDKGVLVFVPLNHMQLYPEGPFLGRKCAAYIKCDDALFVRVHYDINEKRLKWVASKAWISMFCGELEGQDAVTVETKEEFMSTMSGKLALVTSNRGEISREIGMTVYFSNLNAFLFGINLSQMDLQKVFIEGETLHYILPEDRNEMYMEASKVWYETLDSKETVNQRVEALIGYWMKRDLDKPTLRTMIKELKRQYVEQNLQILPKDIGYNSISAGDNISCFPSEREEKVLNEDTKSDVEELKQAEPNLQMVLRKTASSNLCNNDSSFNNMCFDRDVSAPIKYTSSGTDESKNKMYINLLHSNDTQDLIELTVHSRSVVNKVTIALNLPFYTGYGKQNIFSAGIFANRELSIMAFENKHLSAVASLKQKALNGLLHFVRDGLTSPSILQEIQIWQNVISPKHHDDEETPALAYYLLKQIGVGSGRGSRQLVKYKKAGIVNLSEQEEHMETSDTNQYKLKKERYVAVNQSSHKVGSVNSGDSKCMDSLRSHSDAAQCLVDKESKDVREMPFHDGLLSLTEPMNKKVDKEVQTVSTGDILYFKIVPDM